MSDDVTDPATGDLSGHAIDAERRRLAEADSGVPWRRWGPYAPAESDTGMFGGNSNWRGPDGRRPLYGGIRMFQPDPHWRDLPLFPEYVHGDDGAALGASHRTGWTGLVAVFPQMFAGTRPEDIVALGLWGPR